MCLCYRMISRTLQQHPEQVCYAVCPNPQDVSTSHEWSDSTGYRVTRVCATAMNHRVKSVLLQLVLDKNCTLWQEKTIWLTCTVAQPFIFYMTFRGGFIWNHRYIDCFLLLFCSLSFSFLCHFFFLHSLCTLFSHFLLLSLFSPLRTFPEFSEAEVVIDLETSIVVNWNYNRLRARLLQ